MWLIAHSHWLARLLTPSARALIMVSQLLDYLVAVGFDTQPSYPGGSYCSVSCLFLSSFVIDLGVIVIRDNKQSARCPKREI